MRECPVAYWTELNREIRNDVRASKFECKFMKTYKTAVKMSH